MGAGSVQGSARMRREPVQSRSRRTVERIRQAARDVLSTEGLEALTTNLIAERAGVNIATLYGYFPDKYAILTDLFNEYEKQRTELIEHRLTDLASAEDWHHVVALSINELAEFRRAHPAQIELRRALQGIPSLRELDLASTRQVANDLSVAIRARNPAVDLESAQAAASAAAHLTSTLLDLAYSSDPADDRMVQECRHVFIRYLSPYLEVSKPGGSPD